MGAIFPNETSIYIVAKDTDGSTLSDSDKIVGEITNWAKSGGEQEIESVPVIGGFVDKENPRSQIEVSFDVIVSNLDASALDRYDKFYLGETGSITGESTEHAIFIEHSTNDLHKTFAFNNCRAVTWDPEMAADDMLKGTITFKLSPQTPLGVSNLKTSALEASDPFFDW